MWSVIFKLIDLCVGCTCSIDCASLIVNCIAAVVRSENSVTTTEQLSTLL